MIHEYLASFRSLSDPAFRQAHPYPVLVASSLRAEVTQSHYHTVMSSSDDGRQVGQAPLSELLILPVRKRVGGIYADLISVGRTRASDIHLAHPQVSKLHGYFSKVPGTERYCFADTDATNGTFIDGVRLLTKQRVELGESATIALGSFELQFLMTEPFRSFLARLAARST